MLNTSSSVGQEAIYFIHLVLLKCTINYGITANIYSLFNYGSNFNTSNIKLVNSAAIVNFSSQHLIINKYFPKIFFFYDCLICIEAVLPELCECLYEVVLHYFKKCTLYSSMIHWSRFHEMTVKNSLNNITK